MRRGTFKWLGTLGLIVAVSVMFLSNLSAKKEKVSAPKEYVIGGMQALSGIGFAKLTRQLAQGSELAVDEINAAGGIDGVPMKLVLEDHQAKGPVAVSAFNKLIDIDKVPVSFIGFTAPVMATAPVADERKVLMINCGAVGPTIVGCGKYVFHLPVNEIECWRAVLDYAKKKNGLKTLGLIYVNDDMGISVRDFLKKYCPKIGVTLAGAEAIAVDSTDFTAQIIKAKAWKADGIAMSVHKGHYTLVKQAREMGWNPRWLGLTIYAYVEFIERVGEAMEGALTATGDANPERHPGMVRLKELWENKHGEGSFPKAAEDFIAGQYAYPYIVKKCVEYGKKKGWSDYWTGKRLRQALVEIRTFSTPSGNITFDVKMGTSSHNMRILKIEKGDKEGKYQWNEVAYYPVDKMTKFP